MKTNLEKLYKKDYRYNKLFTIIFLLSLLLFSSCELIAQEIAGEKAAGAEKLDEKNPVA